MAASSPTNSGPPPQPAAQSVPRLGDEGAVKPATYADYLKNDVARQRLHDMLHHRRSGPEDVLVPTRVRREVAESFLTEQITTNLGPEQLQRAGDIARFYVVRSAVPRFAALLVRKEQTAGDLMKAIECLRVLGDLGDESQQQLANEYFDLLLVHPRFVEVIPQMLECYVHLNSASGEVKLAAAIRRRLAAIANQRAEGTEPSDESVRLQEYLEGDLPVATQARSRKEALLGEKDPARRAAALARFYLGIDAYGVIEWPKFAAFKLQQELQQNGAENVIKGFQQALETIPEKETADFKEQARARAFKAILYFGGDLSAPQKQWLENQRTGRFQLQN